MFSLAYELKRPVYELEEDMPPDEFAEWGGFFAWKNEQERAALEKAKQEARARK